MRRGLQVLWSAEVLGLQRLYGWTLAFTDLNGDGEQELFAALYGRGFLVFAPMPHARVWLRKLASPTLSRSWRKYLCAARPAFQPVFSRQKSHVTGLERQSQQGSGTGGQVRFGRTPPNGCAGHGGVDSLYRRGRNRR